MTKTGISVMGGGQIAFNKVTRNEKEDKRSAVIDKLKLTSLSLIVAPRIARLFFCVGAKAR